MQATACGQEQSRPNRCTSYIVVCSVDAQQDWQHLFDLTCGEASRVFYICAAICFDYLTILGLSGYFAPFETSWAVHTDSSFS